MRVWNALVIVLLLLLALVLPTAIHGTDHLIQVLEELWEGVVDWVRAQWWWPRAGRFGERDGSDDDDATCDSFSPGAVRVRDEMESTLEQLHNKARLAADGATSPSPAALSAQEHKARAWAEGVCMCMTTLRLGRPSVFPSPERHIFGWGEYEVAAVGSALDRLSHVHLWAGVYGRSAGGGGGGNADAGAGAGAGGDQDPQVHARDGHHGAGEALTADELCAELRQPDQQDQLVQHAAQHE
jgi:hypothetical protein